MIGIDEVGRGAWAGPLLVAAVELHRDIPKLTDSKLLTSSKRDYLAKLIRLDSTIGFGWVSPGEVDELGLTKALYLASSRAVAKFDAKSQIVIDGSINFLPDFTNVTTLVKADLSVPSVSAASIVAKVARDSYMKLIHNKYPSYGFDKHVGYGTKQHQEAILEHGPCKIHRFSYKPVHDSIQS